MKVAHKLEGIRYTVLLAILLPVLVFAAMSTVQLIDRYGRYQSLDRDRQLAAQLATVLDVRVTALPAEIDADVIRRGGFGFGPLHALAASREMLDAGVSRILESFPKDKRYDVDRAALLKDMAEIRTLRASEDRRGPSGTNAQAPYAALMETLDRLSFKIGDSLEDDRLIKSVRTLDGLIDACNAGLMVAYSGSRYLSGEAMLGDEAGLQYGSVMVLELYLSHEAENQSSAAARAVSIFENSPLGLRLRDLTQKVAARSVPPSQPDLLFWNASQRQRYALWQSAIQEAIGKLKASGSEISDNARREFQFLAAAAVASIMLMAALIVLAIKGLRWVQQLIDEREILMLELTKAAETDTLTGLFNRRGFEHSSRKVLAQCRRDGVPVGAVLFDIDHFKRVNDTHGHDVGDLVLRAVADAAGAMLRPGDLLVRHGGEEFVALLPGADLDQTVAAAERMRQHVQSVPVSLNDGTVISVTASFGCASSVPTATGDIVNALVKKADLALYAAKFSGRNRVEKEGAADALRPLESAYAQALG